MTPPALADGSSVADSPARVTIDLQDDLDRLRYRCPHGHCSWEPTNSHIWCKACADAAQQGVDVDPEHWLILDARTDEEIPWSAIELVE